MEVLQRTANRGSISTGYDIDNSLKFESDNSEYLKAEGRPAGNQQVWTWSCWLKRTEVNNGAIAQYIFSAGSDGKLGLYFRDDASSTGGDTIFIYVDEGNSLKWIGELRVSFRDTSAWYHIVFAVDSTDSTPADRTKIYVNGVQQTITFNATLNQNSNTRIGDGGGKLSIGAKMDGSYEFNGYMAEVVLVDGSQLTPTSFGEFDEDSGIWKPKDVSSISLGTAGFHMNFDDSSDLGKVKTGTSQGDFDLYNITSADQATDTPTNNFATLNPLHYTTKYTITEGGTNQVSSANGWGTSVGSVGVTSGKWYFEVQSADTNGYTLLGVIDQDSVIGTYVNGDAHAGDAPYGIAYYGGNGSIITNGSAVSGLSFPTWTTETMGCALDLDNNKIYFSKSGTYGNSGDPAAGSNGVSLPTGGSGTWFISTSTYFAASPAKTNQGGYTTNSISSAASDANGYGTFEYAPPSGYYALCGKNLAEYGGTA